jgi:hypothetical protein
LSTAGSNVLLISCADKLYNARPTRTDLATHGLAVFERFNAGREGTIWYHGALAVSFQRLLPGPLSDELATSVAELGQMAATLDRSG